MKSHRIYQLEIKTADHQIYLQMFSHRPTSDDVLETNTVVAVRDLVRCFETPQGDGPLVCRMAGAFIGEIKVTEISLFENGDN